MRGEYTMEAIIDFYTFAIETFGEILCLCALYSMKLKNTCHPILSIILYLGLGTLFSYIFPISFAWVLIFPLSYFIYKYMFHKNNEETLLGYIFVYLYFVIFEEIFILAFKKMHIEDPYAQALIGSTSSFLIGVILFRFIPMHKLFCILNNGTKKSAFIRFSLVNLTMLYLIVVFLYKYTNFDVTLITPLIIIFSFIIITTDYLLIKQQRTIARQQESLENYQTYEPMMDSLIEDIRRRQHDFSNELNAINMISCTYNNYESLSHALNEHAEHLTRDFHSTNLVHLNMKVLAGFLHSKKSTAAAEKKDLDIKINSYVLNSQMPEYELIKVVGILIDNALEATDEDGTVKLEIGSRDDKLTFATVNKGPKLTPKLRSDMVKAGYTTKEPACSDKTNGKRKRPAKRGYGLANALDLLTEYGGELYIENPESDGDTLIRFEFIV